MAEGAVLELGDKIAGLTLMQAKELTDYLKDKYGIEPAAGGVMMAGPAAAAAAPVAEAKTEFNVVIKAGGPQKLQVIKIVREARSDLGLKEAKAIVDEAPKTLLEGVNKDDAEKWRKKLEDAGATISVE